MSLSLDAAKDAKEAAREGNLRETDAGIPEEQQINYDEYDPAEVSGHAESMIVFDHIARISINDYGAADDDGLLGMEQNLENAGRYGFDVVLTLADPEIVEGEVWKEDGDGEYIEHKVIGDPEADSNNYELRESIIKDEDGNPTGTEINGIGNIGTSSWDGQPVEDGFENMEYIEVSISSRRAANILGALDTAGKWARNQDGEVVEGLLEAPPNFGTEHYDSDEDGAPRLVGYPELRADMVGQKGAIAFTFGDEGSSGNRPKEVDVFKVDDGELEALTSLTPDDDAYAKPTYPRTNNFYWDDETTPQGADAEPETDETVADAQAAMGDEVTYDDLNDDEQVFVDDAAGGMVNAEMDGVEDFAEQTNKSFEERVATSDLTLEHDADVLGEIAEARMEGQ